MRGYRALTANDDVEDWLDYYCGWKVSEKPEVVVEVEETPATWFNDGEMVWDL